VRDLGGAPFGQSEESGAVAIAVQCFLPSSMPHLTPLLLNQSKARTVLNKLGVCSEPSTAIETKIKTCLPVLRRHCSDLPRKDVKVEDFTPTPSIRTEASTTSALHLRILRTPVFRSLLARLYSTAFHILSNCLVFPCTTPSTPFLTSSSSIISLKHRSTAA
jgi:hypothetical protein